jgi:hypothetical protein
MVGQQTLDLFILVRIQARQHTMKFLHTDQRIDDYFATLPTWQQDVCRQVRELVHTAEPEIVETIKRTNWPFFTLNGNVCALRVSKEHISIVIYDPIAPDPEGIINQGNNNLTARSIKLINGETVNEKALVNLIKAIVASNRAGGWRKAQKSVLQ